jgi:hypothetical protein
MQTFNEVPKGFLKMKDSLKMLESLSDKEPESLKGTSNILLKNKDDYSKSPA